MRLEKRYEKSHYDGVEDESIQRHMGRSGSGV